MYICFNVASYIIKQIKFPSVMNFCIKSCCDNMNFKTFICVNEKEIAMSKLKKSKLIVTSENIIRK